MPTPSEFTRSPNKPFNVAVVGGGIGGLILTLSLLKHRIPVTLYEAASKFGEIGAGVSFGPNATRAMQLISPHIHQAFEARATRNQWDSKKDFWFDFRYGQGEYVGGKITSLKCEGGQASVHRAHFLDELVKLLPDGIAKFGKRATGIEDLGSDGVIIKFQDGTDVRHDAVIGCDGIKSRIRPIVLGASDPAAKAVYSGKFCYRGLIPMDKARELLGNEFAMNSQMYLGNHGHVLTFGVEKGKTMNVVAFSSSEKWEHEEWVIGMKKEDMYSSFSNWGSSVQGILSLMEKPDIWALFNHPPAITYYTGRIALLGDAAHASTPHMGAGAGMAIEDVYILGELLAAVQDKGGIEAAFKAYDAARRPRSTGLVERSRSQGQLYEFELAGDEAETIKRQLEERMAWVWEYDLTKDLEEARALLGTQFENAKI